MGNGTQAIGALGTLLRYSKDGGDTYATIAEIRSIQTNGLIQKQFTECTPMESPNRREQSIVTLFTEGTLTVEVNFLPGNDQHKDLRNDSITEVIRHFEIVYPDDASTKDRFGAQVLQFNPNATAGQVLSATIEFRVMGGEIIQLGVAS